VDAHLDEVEDAIGDGDPAQFAFWSIDQPEQAPDEPEARVLRALADEIGISAQQLGSLSRHRAAIRAQRAALQRCHALLTRVRAQVHEHVSASAAIMHELRQILSPLQVAKFLVWVDRTAASLRATPPAARSRTRP